MEGWAVNLKGGKCGFPAILLAKDRDSRAILTVFRKENSRYIKWGEGFQYNPKPDNLFEPLLCRPSKKNFGRV